MIYFQQPVVRINGLLVVCFKNNWKLENAIDNTILKFVNIQDVTVFADISLKLITRN